MGKGQVLSLLLLAAAAAEKLVKGLSIAAIA